MSNISLFILIATGLFAMNNPVIAEQNRTWSFDFSDISISDALSKIGHESSIEIILNGEPSKVALTKSYNHFTLDDIFMDMFSNQSFIALFNYNNHILSSINIWVMPKADSMNGNSTTFNKRINNRKTFNDQGQIKKIEHNPGLSRQTREIQRSSNSKSISNKNKSNPSLHIRQSSSLINRADGSKHDNQDKLSDHDELIDVDDNLDNDSPPDQKQFSGLEPPPMPPGISFDVE